MTLKHAQHNFKVCSFLYEETDFNDWIVTTAYYSTIHYICHKLFPGKFEDPLTGNITAFPSFKKYCLRLQRGTSKHKVLEDLVSENLPEIFPDFKTLKDLCWTARYDDYVVQKEFMEVCYTGINSIASFCENE